MADVEPASRFALSRCVGVRVPMVKPSISMSSPSLKACHETVPRNSMRSEGRTVNAATIEPFTSSSIV